MIRKTRSDKKDTICKRCGHECPTPQKLREHLKRKNLCKPLHKEKPHVVIPTSVPELVPEKEAPVLGVDYITAEEAKNWVSPNARKPRERIKTWEQDCKNVGKN